MEASYYRQSLAVAEGLRTTQTLAHRFSLVAALTLASGAFLHALAPHLRPGWPRLALVAPAVALNAWIPLLFDADAELLSCVLLTFTHTWLATFKVRAWAHLLLLCARASRWWCAARAGGGGHLGRAPFSFFSRPLFFFHLERKEFRLRRR